MIWEGNSESRESETHPERQERASDGRGADEDTSLAGLWRGILGHPGVKKVLVAARAAGRMDIAGDVGGPVDGLLEDEEGIPDPG